jgi:hypothetical protein
MYFTVLKNSHNLMFSKIRIFWTLIIKENSSPSKFKKKKF